MKLFSPIITGSVYITGSLNVEVGGDVSDIFLIRNANGNVLSVSGSGVLVLATQSIDLNAPAPNGGVYFTSGSFFVGLD